MSSSTSRPAVLPLIGGLLGAVIGGGSSYATAQTANSSENLRFTFTQERTAYVQVATATDALLTSITKLYNAKVDEDAVTYAAAQEAARADFLRFSQAYNEAFLVLADTSELEQLYEAGVDLDFVVRFEEYDLGGQDAALDVYGDRTNEFLEAARVAVRARLRETQ